MYDSGAELTITGVNTMPQLLSVLPSIVILGAAAIAALLLATRSPSPPENLAARLAASNALAVATGLQCIHFVEELATGFNEQFPNLLGLPSMSFTVFVVFNLVWIAIWIASIPGLRSARRVAFFAAWFLAIAGALNGIGHPLMAVAAGGYFPGLVSSPFVGLACIWLWLRLREATRPGTIAERALSPQNSHRNSQ